MHDVFLSYSRDDEAFVNALEERLRTAGLNAWVDRRNLPVSLPWLENVGYAIASSVCLVACSSAAFDRSSPCAEELRIAHEQGVPVVTVEVVSGVRAAAQLVRDALGRLGELGVARAELTRRAIEWDRSGRTAALLLYGRLLRDTRKRVRKQQVDLVPLLAHYLRSSTRRARRRRVAALAGSSLLVISVGLVLAARSANKLSDRRAGEAVRSLLTAESTADALKVDPYEGVARAAAHVRSAPPEAFTPRERLMKALAVPLPDRSGARQPSSALGRSACERPTCRSAKIGRTYATANGRGIVTVRRGSSVLRRITAGGRGDALAISPDERTLAVAVGPRIRLFAIATGALITELRGLRERDRIRAMRFMADGSIEALSGSRRVSHWDWRSGEVLFDDRQMWFMALSPVDADGTLVAVTRDGRFVRLDVTADRAPRELALRLRGGVVTGADFSPDGRRGLLAMSDDSLALVDLSRERLLKRSKLDCAATSVAFERGSRTAWLSCLNAPLARVDASTLRQVASADTGPLGSTRVVIAGSDVLAADVAPVINRVHRGKKPEQVFSTLCGTSRAMSASPDGETALVVGDGAGVTGCSAVGRRSSDGSWGFNIHILPRRPGQQSRASRFSPDGRVAAVGYSDGTVTTLRLPYQTPGWLFVGPGGSVRDIEFTPDGKRMVVATRDGLVEVLPACPMCGDVGKLVGLAKERLALGRRMRLTDSRVPARERSG